MSDTVPWVYIRICIYTFKPHQTKNQKSNQSVLTYINISKKEDKILRVSIYSQQ